MSSDTGKSLRGSIVRPYRFELSKTVEERLLNRIDHYQIVMYNGLILLMMGAVFSLFLLFQIASIGIPSVVNPSGNVTVESIAYTILLASAGSYLIKAFWKFEILTVEETSLVDPSMERSPKRQFLRIGFMMLILLISTAIALFFSQVASEFPLIEQLQIALSGKGFVGLFIGLFLSIIMAGSIVTAWSSLKLIRYDLFTYTRGVNVWLRRMMFFISYYLSPLDDDFDEVVSDRCHQCYGDKFTRKEEGDLIEYECSFCGLEKDRCLPESS